MYYLGLDTSNYTTSAAVVREDVILCDERVPLVVPSKEKGLRQSEALFQHWRNLPGVLRAPLSQFAPKLTAVCVSGSPRPAEGSYMPVFGAGVSAGRILSQALGIPLFQTSHQEGHLRAGAAGTDIDLGQPLIAAHLSGGTLEFLKLREGSYELVGGTMDLSYGQLLDRTGQFLGLDFPAGGALDRLAQEEAGMAAKNPLGPVFQKDAWINLSGMETQMKQLAGNYEPQLIASFLFQRISENLISILEYLKSSLEIDQVLITGGVAASRTLRAHCRERGYEFAAPHLCGDNAVGTALLKGQPLCRSNP